MLLTIDAGNTNIAIGLLDEGKVTATYRLTTKTPRTSDEYGICLNMFLENYGHDRDEIEDVIISSVVPNINYSLSSAIIKYIGKAPIFVTKDLDSGIGLDVDNPVEVGADLIVEMAAVYKEYGHSCIVIDFGTATTYAYLSGGGVFRGLVIAPGLQATAAALTSQAAMLPAVEITKPAHVLGRNTVACMQSGIVNGYIGEVEYIVRSIKEEMNDPDCTVIATGGMGRVISGETSAIDIYDPDLAYKGMYILYQMNK